MQSSTTIGIHALSSPGGEGLPFAEMPTHSASHHIRPCGINEAIALTLLGSEAPSQIESSFFLFLESGQFSAVVSDARLKLLNFLPAWPF